MRREWVFIRWLRPVAPVPTTTGGGLKAEVDQAVQALRSALEEGLEEVRTTVRTLNTQMDTWTTQVDQHLGTLRAQMDQVQDQVRTLSTQNLDAGAATGPGAHPGQGMSHAQLARREQGTLLGRERTQTEEDQGRTTGSHTEAEDQSNAAELILAALLRLGVNTPNTWIAREVGCSRKTVARWRKRFQEQGRLSRATEHEQKHV